MNSKTCAAGGGREAENPIHIIKSSKFNYAQD